MAQTKESNSLGQDTQQILQAGMEAAKLMNSPIFGLAYRETLNHYFNEWVSTEREHSRKRDEIYFRVCGLEDVAKTLAGYVQQAETLAQQQSQQDPNQFMAEAYQ